MENTEKSTAADIPGLRAEVPFGDGFTLVRRLGAGGMGEVWLAYENALRRNVALKIMRMPPEATEANGKVPEDADAETASQRVERAMRRFHREADILAQCAHPSILPVWRSGVDAATGLPYYATRPCLLDSADADLACREILGTPWHGDRRGRDEAPLALSLADVMRQGGTLPELSVARIGRALVSAVAYAHALPEPVVHRDIKPSNILLSKDGGVILSDFGIAKRIHAQDADTTTTNSRKAGLFVGTFDYAAPEQQDGDEITPASDYYSIAAVLYEALTGAKPRSLEKPSDIAPGRISRNWDILLRRMLEPDPAKRLCDPAQIDAALKAICQAPALRCKARRIAAVSIGVLMALAIAVAVAIRAARDRENSPEGGLRALIKLARDCGGEASPGARRTIMLPGGVPMEFAYVWGDNPFYERGKDGGSEMPPPLEGTVVFTNGFWLAATEFTCAQSRALFKSPENVSEEQLGKAQNIRVPNAMTLLAAANTIELPPGEYLDLPTEAEWEFACRQNLCDLPGGEEEICKQVFGVVRPGLFVSPADGRIEYADNGLTDIPLVMKGGSGTPSPSGFVPELRRIPEYGTRGNLRFVLRRRGK